MSVSAWAGPLVAFGQSPTSDYNPHGGPSLFLDGAGLLDPRVPFTYVPGMRPGKPFYGFLGTTHIPVLDVTATAGATSALAAAQVPTAGTALTLVSSTSAPITVGVSINRSDTGAAVSGLISIHGSASGTAFGQNNHPVFIWDPTTLAARNVTITSVGDDRGGTFTVRGYDIYGYPMTETITGANTGATASGLKAFKYVASITPAGTLSGSNVTAGIGTAFGLPLRVDAYGYLYGTQSTSAITSGNTTVADTTSPATATTGDVRGTIASTGTTRIVVHVTPTVANVAAGATGLFGVTQYADF